MLILKQDSIKNITNNLCLFYLDQCFKIVLEIENCLGIDGMQNRQFLNRFLSDRSKRYLFRRGKQVTFL